MQTQKIITNLWFNDNAEEAIQHYTSIFGGQILRVVRYGAAGPGPEGAAMVVSFELFGQRFEAINGFCDFPFSEATSLAVECETQEEIDRYWNALLEGGGREQQCGWLKDKYGLPWQIVPKCWAQWDWEADPVRTERTMRAMLSMVKMDIAALERAYHGE